MSEKELNECIYESREGDIIFFAEPSGEPIGFTDAVAKSYASEERFVHVGLVAEGEDVPIIHALPGRGVIENDAIDLTKGFLKNGGRVVVKRMQDDVAPVNDIVETAYHYLKYPYNDIFSDDNLNSKGEFSFYCSQFVEFVFQEAFEREIFLKHPMSFNDQNGDVIPYWNSYFSARRSEIPEGKMGTHPGSIYENENLIFVCSAEINYHQHDDL